MRFASATSSAILLTGWGRMHDDRHRGHRHKGDRREIAHCIIWQFLIQGRVDGVRSNGRHEQRAPMGADLATVSAPNEPPAPPRLSITTTDLSVCPNICANGRATMSVGPPAGNGTTRRICRPAIDCAAAFLGSDTKLMATALTARKATRLINPSKLSRSTSALVRIIRANLLARDVPTDGTRAANRR